MSPPATAPMLHTAWRRLTIGRRVCASTPTATTFIATSWTPSATPASTWAATNQPIAGGAARTARSAAIANPPMTVVRPAPNRANQWRRGSRPGDAAERERDERDAESAHGGTELGGQCGCRREPHGRGDAVHEERGGDATHGRDVDLGEGALGGDGEKGRRRARAWLWSRPSSAWRYRHDRLRIARAGGRAQLVPARSRLPRPGAGRMCAGRRGVGGREAERPRCAGRHPRRAERRHRRRAPAPARALRPLGERGRRDRPPSGDARLEARDVGVRLRLGIRGRHHATRAHDARCGDRGGALPRLAGRYGARVQHGHDEWRRGTRRRVRAARRTRRSPRGPAGRLARTRHRRFHVPHRARRWLRSRQHGPLRRARPRRRARADRRREVVLLERRRRSDRAARPTRRRDGGLGRTRALPRSRAPRRRGAQPLHDPPTQGQARDQERADGRSRVPRCDRLRAARATRRFHPAPMRAG